MTTIDKRKTDHILLTEKAQFGASLADSRFYYEPLLGSHQTNTSLELNFLGKKMQNPLWISSMTGGTGQARHINLNLAQAANEFGFGMGLGSCRPLLENDQYFNDFNLRPILGKNLPFFANLGIVQIDELLIRGQVSKLVDVLGRLDVDGLIIHLNPMQELFQPEGDFLPRPSLEVIQDFLEIYKGKIIVKEVGQGMGPESLKLLMKMPISAIEFGALGGTNFSKLEMLRDKDDVKTGLAPLSFVGHTALEMVGFVNSILENEKDILCQEFIISGGVKNFLDGHYLLSQINANAVYGQARSFLTYANEDYDKLKYYCKQQVDGLKMASQFLRVRS